MTGELQMVRQCVCGQLAGSMRIGCFIMSTQKTTLRWTLWNEEGSCATAGQE
jgi:hypothetical protein